MQTEITVAFVNPPKSAKGPGSVKDKAGTYYKVWPDMLANFQQGGTYSVEYVTEQYQGKEQREIKAIKGNGAAAPIAKPAYRAPETGAPPRVEARLPASTGTTPKDEMIFVCGGLNSILKNPDVKPLQLTSAEIASIVRVLRTAWSMTLGAPTAEATVADTY